jgi:hypothetical protein
MKSVMQPDQDPNNLSDIPSDAQANEPEQPTPPNQSFQQPEGAQPEAAPNDPPAAEPQQPEAKPEQPDQPQPQVVYVSRPINPDPPHISEEALAKHEEAKKKYPTLNLSHGEYVISSVSRHPIGLIPIFGLVGAVLVVLGASVPFYDSFRSSSSGTLPPTGVVALIALLLAALVVIGGYIAVYVYISNKFFLTNESVIQEIQTSLFDRHEQTVSLINIEDASFEQRGILPMLLNYGNIRLSTEGDETTYRFNYVSNPKKEIALLNNAVEAFKNGRPVIND